MIDLVRCLEGFRRRSDTTWNFAWSSIWFFVKQQKNVNVLYLQGLFCGCVGEFGIFLVWFVAGVYLDLLYVLPVAVCVNGFLREVGERRFDDGVWCLFRAAPFTWCVHPPPFSWTTKKVVIVRKEQTGSSSGVFVFERHFSLKYLIEFIFNFCIFVFFFYSVVLRNWPWATALYSAPNPITPIITTTPRR